MIGRERVEVEVGQDIAVDDEKSAVQAIPQKAQRSDGAKRFWLVGVFDVKIPLAAIPTSRLEQAAEVASGDVDITRAVPAKPFEQELENRLGADRHQWLGQNHRVGPKARTLAATLNDHFHVVLLAAL